MLLSTRLGYSLQEDDVHQRNIVGDGAAHLPRLSRLAEAPEIAGHTYHCEGCDVACRAILVQRLVQGPSRAGVVRRPGRVRAAAQRGRCQQAWRQ